jgi:hypothetical protein
MPRWAAIALKTFGVLVGAAVLVSGLAVVGFLLVVARYNRVAKPHESELPLSDVELRQSKEEYRRGSANPARNGPTLVADSLATASGKSSASIGY